MLAPDQTAAARFWGQAPVQQARGSFRKFVLDHDLDVIEAAYRVDTTPAVWLHGVLSAARPHLDAGLGAARPGESADAADALRAGLELTRKQLLKVAEDNGLSVVDPQGQAFDPDQHQAISQAESVDAAPGTVLQVFQKGYLLNGRLLRPALVVVARHDD